MTGGGRLRARRPILAVLLTALGPLAVLSACGSSQPPATVFRYTIPKGTQGLIMTNRAPVIFPKDLVVHVGDSIVITNDDDYAQDIGPYRVTAHSQLTQRFSSPGVLEGACSVAVGGNLTVKVIPRED